MERQSLQLIYSFYQKKFSDLSKNLLIYENQKFSLYETIHLMLEELIRIKKEAIQSKFYDEIFVEKLNRFIIDIKGELNQNIYRAEKFSLLHQNLENLIHTLDYDYCIGSQKEELKTKKTQKDRLSKKKTDKYIMAKNGTMHFIIPYKKLIKASKVLSKKRAIIKIVNRMHRFEALPGIPENEKKLRTAVLVSSENDDSYGLLFDQIDRIFYMDRDSFKKKLKYIKHGNRYTEYFLYRGIKYYFYPLLKKTK